MYLHMEGVIKETITEAGMVEEEDGEEMEEELKSVNVSTTHQLEIT